MDFRFETIEYSGELPSLPKRSGVYKIFDVRGKLIVLDKTSNLFERFQRYYIERSEAVRDLDLRRITGRIEYLPTDSPFETMLVLYRPRQDGIEVLRVLHGSQNLQALLRREGIE